MNLLLELLILFVFLHIVFIFELPSNVIRNEDDEIVNLLGRKAGLFLAVFVFYYLFGLVTSITDGIPINQNQIIKNCFSRAVTAVIGYMIYTDYTLANGTIDTSIASGKLNSLTSFSPGLGSNVSRFNMQHSLASGSIILTILVANMIDTLYNSQCSSLISNPNPPTGPVTPTPLQEKSK